MRLITARQVSVSLGVPLQRVYELCRTGMLPCVRLGRKQIRFDEDELVAFVKRGGAPVSNDSNEVHDNESK